MKIKNLDQPSVPAVVHSLAFCQTGNTSFLPKRRQTHRKRHLAWEQMELANGGFYAHNLNEIAHRYPTLTPMEMRVSALVNAMLPSWKIAEMLCIKEESVERYRCRIRRKLGIHGGWLQQYLVAI